MEERVDRVVLHDEHGALQVAGDAVEDRQRAPRRGNFANRCLALAGQVHQTARRDAENDRRQENRREELDQRKRRAPSGVATERAPRVP